MKILGFGDFGKNGVECVWREEEDVGDWVRSVFEVGVEWVSEGVVVEVVWSGIGGVVVWVVDVISVFGD